MTSTAIPTPQTGEAWPEAKLEDSLAHLEKLQEQIDLLRCAIPSMIYDLRVPHQSPDHLAKSIYRIVENANSLVRGFGTDWNSARTKEILAKAEASYKADRDVSPAYKLPTYGWSNQSSTAFPQKDGRKEGGSADVGKAQDVSKILEEFKTQYPDIEIEQDSKTKDVTLRLKTLAQPIAFTIETKNDTREGTVFNIVCHGSSATISSINRCLLQPTLEKNLRSALELIAAYRSLGAPSCVCAKCRDLFDNNVLTPTARRLKSEGSDAAGNPHSFDAFHESCLPTCHSTRLQVP